MFYRMQIQSTEYIILVYWIQMQGTEYNFGLVINTNAKHWIKFWFISNDYNFCSLNANANHWFIILVYWIQMQSTEYNFGLFNTNTKHWI